MNLGPFYHLPDYRHQTLAKLCKMYNGYFYAQFTTNSRRDGMVCMDMNGKVL